MSPFTLLAVFAHPDDEAFGTGGTLARYAAEGNDVFLVTATRGEAGQIKEPREATPANLPQVRERELRCACQIYGIHPPIFLDYVDGQLTTVHQGQAVAKIVRLVREIKPQVVITFGPDGIYGHYDHIAVHRWTTIAVDLAADPDCFPDLDICEPHQVQKVYFRTLVLDEIKALQESNKRPAVMMDGVPFYFFGKEPSTITTTIDVKKFSKEKLAGIRCHSTQIGPGDRFSGNNAEIMDEEWFGWENYILANSKVGDPGEVENDLFARISES